MNYLASFPSIKLIISFIFSKPAKSLRAFFLLVLILPYCWFLVKAAAATKG